jgi:hypothetical protein
LEQARDIAVSRQVLDSIAGALRLDPRERRHLFALAATSPADIRREQPVDPTLRKLVDALHPNPAYLRNPRGDLLGWNAAHATVLGDPADFPQPERNIYWLVFTGAQFRSYVINWPQLAQSMLTQYRAEAAQHQGDASFDRLTAALCEASDDFRRWWADEDTSVFVPPQWRLDHPQLGQLAFDYVKFANNADPNIKLVAGLPSDSRSTDKLNDLAPLNRPH